jgi:hypothetical protein
MKKKLLFIVTLLLISFSTLRAQTEEQIINEILFNLWDYYELFLRENDTIYIVDEKIKTHFSHDSISFKSCTGFAVTSNIISEWIVKTKEKEDLQSKWNEQSLNKTDTIFVREDTIICKKPIFKCVPKNKIEMTSYQTRENVYWIGELLFDNSRENAIFHFFGSSHPNSMWGHTILIKKIFGKWVIITRFDYWMT